MTAADPAPSKTKQWAKLALIPLLSVVLLWMLWQPATPAAGGVDAADAGGSGVQSTAAATTASAAVPSAQHANGQTKSMKPVWPITPLDDLVAFNPFEAEQPGEFADSGAVHGPDGTITGRDAASQRSRLVSIGNLQAIYVDSEGAASAILDSQVVRVGDTLPSGGRVVEISPDGIKLEGL